MSSYTVITVWLCFLAVSAIGATSQTTPTTTTPGTTTPPGSCEFNGKIYENGAIMEEDPYNCYGTTCEDGNVLTWDAACMFHIPVCYGRSEKVLGQCCPVCHDNVTTVPTTIPRSTTPPGGCHYNGKTYANGAKIETDPNNCYGLFCQDGQTVAWDDQCAFHTPYCAGKSEKVAGQCCPVCHNQTTTPPQTTPPQTTTPSIPADGCLVNGKVFTHGSIVTKDPNNCFGSECNYGVVTTWERSCYYPPNVCKGGWLNITGQCCKVCANVTTQPPGTTCDIGNRRFTVGQRTNNDVCHVCRCTVDGTESCSNITCDTVLDCDVKYKPFGACCFTCGSSQMTVNILLLLFILLISKGIITFETILSTFLTHITCFNLPIHQ